MLKTITLFSRWMVSLMVIDLEATTTIDLDDYEETDR